MCFIGITRVCSCWFVLPESWMSKYCKLLSCKWWEMRMLTHKPSWMFSALIHRYVHKSGTCPVSKSQENRINQDKSAAIAQIEHPGLELEGLPRSRCQNPHRSGII